MVSVSGVFFMQSFRDSLQERKAGAAVKQCTQAALAGHWSVQHFQKHGLERLEIEQFLKHFSK